MVVTRVSMFTGKVHSVDMPITQEQYDNWMKGMVVQRAMPDLEPKWREFLISGVTPQEWAEAFGSEETSMEYDVPQDKQQTE